MAVRDLLWGCPLCGGGALRKVRAGAQCGECGTLLRRGRGDAIVARRPGGAEESRPAAAWLDALPPAEARVSGPEPAVMRVGIPDPRPIRYDGELIGWIERFGDPVSGDVELTEAQLVFRPADGTPLTVEIDALTGIQPSSRMLILGRRGDEPVAFRFPESSVLWWERRLQAAVKRRWAASGRGEVVEYQPRIVAR